MEEAKPAEPGAPSEAPKPVATYHCERCGKWKGAHATLPGQPTDHLCHCPAAAPIASLPVGEEAKPAEPVAWRVRRSSGVYELFISKANADRRAECFVPPRVVEPLYASPSPAVPLAAPLTEEALDDAVRLIESLGGNPKLQRRALREVRAALSGPLTAEQDAVTISRADAEFAACFMEGSNEPPTLERAARIRATLSQGEQA